MSFGPNQTTKDATSQLGTINTTAQNNAATQTAQGSQAVDAGKQDTMAGTNWLHTILNGNRTNTASLFAPDISRMRDANQQSLDAASTLMPRGGGRSGTLFGATVAPHMMMQTLFNGARTNAATALPQIGLQQQGIGTGLYTAGNGALNTGMNTNANLASIGQRQQEIANAAWSSIGQGIAGIATTPFGSSGKSLLGRA
jgi:hypothetical protein